MTQPTDTQRETLVDTLSSEAKSPLQKYKEIYVGSNSLSALLRYELLTLFLSTLPGALGFTLRKVFYRLLFAEIGRETIIGPHVTLRCPGRISLGNHDLIDGNVVLDAKGADSRIRLGDAVLVGSNSILSCLAATISIGDDVSIGPHVCIRAGLAPVHVGSQVTIGSHSALVSGNPDFRRPDIPMKRQLGSTMGIHVGDDVWIGIGVKIVDGVRIGSGSVIGAGAVVIDDVPDRVIAAGVPAKVIGTRAQEQKAIR